jgi:hypothetical protein
VSGFGCRASAGSGLSAAHHKSGDLPQLARELGVGDVTGAAVDRHRAPQLAERLPLATVELPFVYAERFGVWGYPSWVRFFVGTVELVGAALLIHRSTRTVAAGLLLPVLIGAVTTHIVNDDPLGDSIMAPTVLVLVVLIAWVTAPWDWTSAWSSNGNRPEGDPPTTNQASRT